MYFHTQPFLMPVEYYSVTESWPEAAMFLLLARAGNFSRMRADFPARSLR